MPTSAEKRVDATLTFVEGRCPATLLNLVKGEVGKPGKKKLAGEYIKLGWGFDSDQRRALRSLLLCQYLLVEARDDDKVTNWGKATFGTKASTKA